MAMHATSAIEAFMAGSVANLKQISIVVEVIIVFC
jgi:hypothetical protein